MERTGYIGTYDSALSHGIYRFKFDDSTGRLSPPDLFHRTKGGKCVALAGKFLVTTKELSDKAGIALLDRKGNILSEVFTEKTTPCFVWYHNDMIYTANYHDGTAIIYKITDQNLHMVKRLTTGNETGCHQVMLRRNFLFVPCLKLDCINIYDAANDFLLTGKITFPQGTGPRHGVFTNNDESLYLVSELSNEMFHYELQSDHSWRLIHKSSFLPAGKAEGSASAALRLSEDEQFIYISTRGSNLMTVFSIKDRTLVKIQQISCGGNHPRDFLLSPGGDYLLVINRSSNELISMRLDKTTGTIQSVADRIEVHEGVGIAIE